MQVLRPSLKSLDGFAAQFAAITGVPFTADDLLTAGERIYNLERHYNNLAGFRRRQRHAAQALPGGTLARCQGSMGHVCELDKMLAEYYRLRGWEDGVVPEAKLKELEII